MAMDLGAIKAKLESLNTQGQEKTDNSKNFWKPQLGESTIRIVPSAYDPAMPFSELKFHYGIGKYPMAALSNFGKQDPIEDFIKELRKTSDKENWSLSGKIQPRSRYFAPVIVRGQESEGVKIWGFGITIYKALLQLASDEEIGDFSDPINGTDLKVTVTAGNPYPDTSIRPKRSSSPLSEDANQVKTWLTLQPNPKTSFTEYSYDFIKSQLEAYLLPKAEGEEGTKEPVITEGKKEKLVAKVPKAVEPVKEIPVAKEKVSTASTFDDLFADEREEDKLPF